MAKKKTGINSSNGKLILPLSVLAVVLGVFAVSSQTVNYSLKSKAGNYTPQIKPSDFTTEITNKYFSLPVGKKMIYEGDTADGRERAEITIPGTTKTIMGVETLLYRDKVWVDKNGNGKFNDHELIEDTHDYVAQNITTGDVWYFGEEVNNYENGKLADHEGSWLAGDQNYPGAIPGILVKQNPKAGEIYLQEYYKGFAEDTVKVLAINQTVKTKLGTFTGCIRTKDYTPLDPEAQENKYYCPNVVIKDVGSTVLIKDLALDEQEELISVTVTNAGNGD